MNKDFKGPINGQRMDKECGLGVLERRDRRDRREGRKMEDKKDDSDSTWL